MPRYIRTGALYDAADKTHRDDLGFNATVNISAVKTSDNYLTDASAATGGTLAAATYYYVVSAINAQGETLKSNELSITTTGATSSNTVSWAAITGATGYRVYRGTATGAQTVYYAVGAVTSYVDTGSTATAGTPSGTNTTGLATPVQAALATVTTGGTLAAATYFYVVSATNSIGETLKSNEQSVATTGATSSNTVSWAAITGATGYRVYRGTAIGAQTVYYAVGAVTSYVDTNAASTAGTPSGSNTTTLASPVQSGLSTAATGGGIPVGGLYHNSGLVKIKLS